MRAALTRGQRPVEELVGRYYIRNQEVRQLLIDYFRRRAADLDYASLKTLILTLAHHFWEKIEAASPGQADLRISPEAYEAWRHSIRLKADGSERRHQEEIVLNVRSFYYDLHSWAVGEPERWAGGWRHARSRRVTLCAASAHGGAGSRSGSADRIRQRQPLLPLLVAAPRRSLPPSARDPARRPASLAPGEAFAVEGRSYQRVWSRADDKRQRGADKPTSVS